MTPVDHPATGVCRREELTAAVREQGYTQKVASGHVDAVFDIIGEQLADGVEVRIRGFGRFDRVTREPRPARDLSTGASILVASRNTVTFRPAAALRERLTAALVSPTPTSEDPDE